MYKSKAGMIDSYIHEEINYENVSIFQCINVCFANKHSTVPLIKTTTFWSILLRKHARNAMKIWFESVHIYTFATTKQHVQRVCQYQKGTLTHARPSKLFYWSLILWIYLDYYPYWSIVMALLRLNQFANWDDWNGEGKLFQFLQVFTSNIKT